VGHELQDIDCARLAPVRPGDALQELRLHALERPVHHGVDELLPAPEMMEDGRVGDPDLGRDLLQTQPGRADRRDGRLGGVEDLVTGFFGRPAAAAGRRRPAGHC
jgi:hypothetical protein